MRKIWIWTLGPLLTTAIWADEEVDRERGIDRMFEMQEKMRPKSVHEKLHRANLMEYAPAIQTAKQSTALVLDGERAVALAAIVTADGFAVSKATELGGPSVILQLADQSKHPARVLKIYEEYDLAILKADGEKFQPVDWAPGKDLAVGTFVVTPGVGPNPLAFGVISVATRNISEARKGFLGVAVAEREDGQGVDVIQVGRRTSAEHAGLRPRDRIIKIDGRPMKTEHDLKNTVANYLPGDTVEIEFERGGKMTKMEATLGDRESGMGLGGNPPMDMTARMGGGLSKQRSGYPAALEHDLMIKANQCGGPLVNLDGKTVGINIARAGRVKSYALPSETVRELVGDPAKLLALAEKSPTDKPEVVKGPKVAATEPAEGEKPKPKTAQSADKPKAEGASVEELERELEEVEEALLKARKDVLEAKERKREIQKALRAAQGDEEEPDE